MNPITRASGAIQAISLALLPALALAQSTTTTGGAPSVGGGNSQCTAITNSTALQNGSGALGGILVFLTGTPFKVACGIFVVAGIILILLDSGQLPQFAKLFITAIIAVAFIGIGISFIFTAPAVATC
ncbi:MAG: hypothetical protein WAN59_10620 [Candidatus Baltobacteraceae bacterium]